MSYIKQTRRISVIMGIYNCAYTLRESIESLLKQSYKDWELIMCDDGSDDNTLKIALEYENKYDNILVIRNECNKGLAASLNHCLDYAESEFIARQDGDDISLPDRFRIQVEFLDSHSEYALVSTSMICFDQNGDWAIQTNPERPQIKDFIYKSPFCHAPCMMRREALEKVGRYTVSKYLKRGQDYYLWHKFYKNGYKGYNIQIPLYKMRDDESAMKRRTFKSRVYGAKIQFEVYRSLGVPFIYYYRIFRPIIVGLLPLSVYKYLHQAKLSRQADKES